MNQANEQREGRFVRSAPEEHATLGHTTHRLAILGVIIGAIWFAPQMIEDASGPCNAYVTRAVTNNIDQIDPGASPAERMIAIGASRIFGGALIESRTVDRQMPSALFCTLSYWSELVAPGSTFNAKALSR